MSDSIKHSIYLRINIQRDEFQLPIELSLPKSGVTAIFGPSGVGKTTLLRTIAGLDKYDGSIIKVGSRTWQDQDHFTPAYDRQLAYVFQEASLFDHLSVQANLEYGVKRLKNRKASLSLIQIVEMLNIEALLNRKPATLSGGQRQRVAIARALASSPCLLLMDEPLSSLDQASKQEILPYIEKVSKLLDIPILYVSHSIEEVSRLADYLVLIDPDGVKAHGTTQQMLTRLDLPLSHYNDAASIIVAQLIDHDDVYTLSNVEFSGERLSVTRTDIPVGSLVRLRIAASDVSITLQRQSDTSILNIVAAEVLELAPDGQAQLLVRLKVANQILLSRITQKSADRLDLQIGKKVYAQAKSVAVMA